MKESRVCLPSSVVGAPDITNVVRYVPLFEVDEFSLAEVGCNVEIFNTLHNKIRGGMSPIFFPYITLIWLIKVGVKEAPTHLAQSQPVQCFDVRAREHSLL